MVDNPNPQNAKRGRGEEHEKLTQNVGQASGAAGNPSGQKAAQQQGASGTADNAGGLRVEGGERAKLHHTGHTEKS